MGLIKIQSKPRLWILIHIYYIGAEDERDFDYVEGSKKGPAYWGEIKKEWAACKHGGMQSPIDLPGKSFQILPSLVELKRTYKPSNATLKNRGHDIKVIKETLKFIIIFRRY